jgi:uncharacterized membrane protein YeiB
VSKRLYYLLGSLIFLAVYFYGYSAATWDSTSPAWACSFACVVALGSLALTIIYALKQK